jgi:hypothetical protein
MPTIRERGDDWRGRLRELQLRLGSNPYVKVGFPEGATYPETGESLPMVAAINEFGAPSRNQPPRPFMRRTIEAHKEEWPRDLVTAFQQNEANVDTAFRIMGEKIKGQIQQSILDFWDPPLKNPERAIRRKGHAKPLIDTAFMLNGVTYEVGKEE